MKKIFFIMLCTLTLVHAKNELLFQHGIKEYDNSKTKVDGRNFITGLTSSFDNHKVYLGYQREDVNREHPVTKASIDSLHVEKYSLSYGYNITKQFDLHTSFIKIIDNLAPTDQGKIYGLGSTYKFPKGFGAGLDFYRSDYEQFDVNQYDLTLFKGFKLGEVKGKATIIAKSIHIDGDSYGAYSFTDKDYFTTGVKLGLNYHGYFGGVGAFFGKRMFTVLNNGHKVQHHAMEQDETYMLSLGKKFQTFDIIAKYSYQNGKEVPENQDDVDQEVFSLALNFKF